MGTTHFKAMAQLSGATVTAVCTRDRKKLKGDWSSVKGNFGDSGGVQNLAGITAYSDIHSLIRDPNVDLVDICLPTPMHVEVAVEAMERGKHVLCEKPIALSLRDADRMLDAADRTGRRLMVAHVLRFFPEFALVKRLADSRDLGSLLGAHLKRVISAPEWGAKGWFSDAEKTGGAALDLHIHDTDFVHYLFGRPDRVFSSGIVYPNGSVNYLVTNYVYGDRNIAVSAESGSIAMKGLKFEHGYDIFFEKGTLQFDSSWGQPPLLYTEDGGRINPDCTTGDPFAAEIGYAVVCLERGLDPELISGESARDSLATCLAEIRSVKTGRSVKPS